MRAPIIARLYGGVLRSLPDHVCRQDLPDMVNTFAEMWRDACSLEQKARVMLAVLLPFPRLWIAEWWDAMTHLYFDASVGTARAVRTKATPLGQGRIRFPIHAGRTSRLEVFMEGVSIDAHTLRDIEIFEGLRGARSIYDLIGQTRTVGGAKVLKERMRRPFSDVARIRATQASIRFITEHRPAFDKLSAEFVVMEVDEYLKSGLPMVESENRFEVFLGALEIRFGDFRPYARLVRGTIRTASFVRALKRIVAALPDDAQGDIAPMIAELRELVGGERYGDLGDRERWDLPAWEILRLDRIFRRRERDTTERLVKLVHQIDALVAMADAGTQYNLVLPEVEEGPLAIEGHGLFNMFVEDPVPTGLGLDQGQRMLFLTGPNMAGKTTYLRTCAVATYLAHLGMGVPATSFRFSPCDFLLTSLTTLDNVRDGISFFRAEALRVKAIAEAVTTGKRVVALFDEPFKGTNLKDALDASRAVLEEFAHASDSLFLISSHLIELGDDMVRTGQVDCRYFEATEEKGRLQFDYLIKDGVSSQRLGMKVLEQEGIFDLFRVRRGTAKPQAAERFRVDTPPAQG